MQTFRINNLSITAVANDVGKICYILYPLDIPATWIEETAGRLGISIAVITHIDWDNALTPWKAPGVPSGSPEFAGNASQFLTLLKHDVIPQIETRLGLPADTERTLAGVSLSGLFALWQWFECDMFTNIISLSGSFWYESFVDWIKSRSVPDKQGRAYFLLGNKEA